MLDLELPQRYRPTTISGLCDATGFTPAEVKRLYWSFKSECPSGSWKLNEFKKNCSFFASGLVNQETFHIIYSKFFPVGGLYEGVGTWVIQSAFSANLSCYPNYVFSALDHRNSGVINFEVSHCYSFVLTLFCCLAGFCHRIIHSLEGFHWG